MNKLLFFILLCTLNDRIILAQPPSYKESIIQYRSLNWKSLIADPRTTLHASDSTYLDYYPIKEKNKVYTSVSLLQDTSTIEMPTYSGKIKTFRRYALLHFVWKRKSVTLTAYQSLQNLTSPIYKDYLFIPFKDLTTDRSTYGGGRYIDIKSGQIQKDHLLLDLNQVYNPWCAYSDGYNCPIPPSENSLPVVLKVGEKKFNKNH